MAANPFRTMTQATLDLDTPHETSCLLAPSRLWLLTLQVSWSAEITRCSSRPTSGRRRSVPPPPGARKGSISASRPAPSDHAEILWSGPHGRARARALELLQPSALLALSRCLEEVTPPPLTLSPPPTGDEDFLQGMGSDFEAGAGASRAKGAAGRGSVAQRHRASPGAGWGGALWAAFWAAFPCLDESEGHPGCKSRVRDLARPMRTCPVLLRVFRVFRFPCDRVSSAGLEASREPRVGSGARQRLCRPCF